MKKMTIAALSLAMVISMTECSFGASESTIPNSSAQAETDVSDDQNIEAKTTGFTGIKLKDFTVKTISGEEFTLSDVLKEKKAVMINLWASWCGPCGSEFPYIQEAYEKYKDSVEILALSVEKTDTDEVLGEYVKEHSMTFPVASDTSVGLGDTYVQEGIPVTLLIDRFGTIVYYSVGAEQSAEKFTGLFDQVIGDDYTESKVIKDDSAAVMPDVEKTDSQTLSAAVNMEGGDLVFDNLSDESVWPMEVRETDGRTVLASTNKGVAESKSEVRTSVTARKGDVLSFDFHISSNPIVDALEVEVDGKVVKTLSGEYDWTTWGIEMEEGTHEVIFRYDRPLDSSLGDDEVLLDNVGIVSGDEAKKIMEGLPVYPVADREEIKVTTDGAREIVLESEETSEGEAFLENLVSDSYYIVPSDTADISFTLTSDIEPGAAYGYSLNSSECTPVTSMKTEGNTYITQIPVSSRNEDGENYNVFYVYPMQENRMFAREEYDKMKGVMLFPSEEDVEIFIKEVKEYGLPELTWHYADEQQSDTSGSDQRKTDAQEENKDESQKTYTVTIKDQDGNGISGCMVNFCSESACNQVTSDADGVYSYSGEAYDYHIQLLKVPEGYTCDLSKEYTADREGGNIDITLTKE